MDPPNNNQGEILFEGSRKLPARDNLNMGRICHCHMNNTHSLLCSLLVLSPTRKLIDLSILQQPHTEVPMSAEKQTQVRMEEVLVGLKWTKVTATLHLCLNKAPVPVLEGLTLTTDFKPQNELEVRGNHQKERIQLHCLI